MADYSKSISGVTYSANSDYSDPVYEKAFTSTYTSPTVCDSRRVTVATGSTDVIDTSTYTSVRFLLVHNQDSTNYVTVTFTNAAAASVALRVPAGETLRITDIAVTADITLQANTAACVCEWVLVGVS